MYIYIYIYIHIYIYILFVENIIIVIPVNGEEADNSNRIDNLVNCAVVLVNCVDTCNTCLN